MDTEWSPSTTAEPARPELEPLYPVHPPPSPRPKRSLKRCLGYTCLILVLILCVPIVYGIYIFCTTLLGNINDPHAGLVYNGTNPVGATVVRPLIDLDTRFDLALTVIARKPRDEEREKEWLERDQQSRLAAPGWTAADEEKRSSRQQATAGWLKVDVEQVSYWGEEEVLWQGIAREGLDMKSGAVDLDIEFDLPLDRFYEHELFFRDLRLGVVLIPQSPSKLDRVEDWTYWKGDVAEQYPSPVDSRIIESVALDQSRIHDVSQRYKLLETMATSYSLLEFHDIPSNCTSNSTSDGLDGDLDDEDDLWSSIRTTKEGDEEEADGTPSSQDVDLSAAGSNDASSRSAGGKSNAEHKPKEKEKGPGKHPYILTRSHLFLINETRLLDRKAFDKKHKHLLETSCGRPLKHLAPSWMMCNRDFHANGNWETRMALLSEKEGGRKELAYGPYVGRLKHSAGPKDVVKIPVSREVCDGKEPDRLLDPKSLHVKHRIKFSTLSPARLNVLEQFATSERVSHNATEASIIHAHDAWRQTVGLFGDRHEGSHPWRRFAISVLELFAVALPVLVLTILYWYTRQTPTGISHIGTALLGLSLIAHATCQIAWGYSTDGVGAAFAAVIFDGIAYIPAFLMLKLVWPFEWADVAPASDRGRWKRWFAGWKKGLRRTRWNHRERRNLRIESNISWPQISALLVGCYIAVCVPLHFGLSVISPVIALPLPEDQQRWYISNPSMAAYETLQIVGTALQLYHNAQTRTFAGGYALAAQLSALKALLDMVWHIPSIVGVYDAHPGVPVHEVINLGMIAVAAWQSRLYPRVEQDVKGDEVEEL